MAVTGSRPRLVKAPTLKENQENALKLPEQYRTNDVFMSNFRKLMGSDTQDLVAQLINEGQVRAEIRPCGGGATAGPRRARDAAHRQKSGPSSMLACRAVRARRLRAEAPLPARTRAHLLKSVPWAR